METYTNYSDSDLAIMIRNGDEKAFSEIYNRYWSKLYMHSRKMLRDEDQAMDIVQDIFTNLWNRNIDIHINTSIKTYLYSAVRNHTLNHINRGKLKDRYLNSLAEFLERGELHTEEQVDFLDFAQRIDREIDRFSPKMKAIFELSRNQGLSNKDIATELNITNHTVKKTINRALQRLKTQVSSFLF